MFDINETKRFQILVNYLIIQVSQYYLHQSRSDLSGGAFSGFSPLRVNTSETHLFA